MRGTVLPLTLGMLILGTIPGVTSDSHGDKQKEMPDPFDALEAVLDVRMAAEKGCNLMMAQHCFLEMAGATVKILGGGMSREEQKKTCWQVHEYRECVEESMSECPMTEGTFRGMRALEPYVPLLSSVANTVCMEEGEREEMDDCQMEAAGHCLMGFFYVAAEAYSPATCWQSLHSSGCLESVLKECKNPYVQHMKSIITNQIRLTSAVTCVTSGCHPDVAFECLMSAKYAAESPLATMYRSPILCGRLKNAMTCVVNNTIGCPMEQYNQLAMGLLHLDKVSEIVCPEDSFSAIPENVITQNLAAMMTIAETPFATPEAVCPYYKYGEYALMTLSLEEFSLENIMKTKMVANNIIGDYCKMDMDKEKDDCERWQTAEPMCDVAQADMCVGMAELPFLLAEIDILGKETVCQEVHKLARCVNSKISGCRMDQLPGYNFTFWKILGEVADFCPLQELLSSSSCTKRKCQTMEAFYKCFPTVTQDDFSSGRSCMMMKNTLECVKMYTSGCVMSLGMVPIAYTVHMYLYQFTPYCMVPHFDEMHDFVTDPRHIEGSFMMLKTLQYALTNGSDIVHDLCHVLYSAYQANEEIKPHPMIAFAIKKMVGYGTELFEYLCLQYPEDSLKTMSTENMTTAQMANQPGCEAENAAFCFSKHTTSMMLFQFLSLEDKHTICRDGYHIVMECIKNFTSGCSAERKAVFESSKEITRILHISFCPSDKMAEFSQLKMDGCAPETAQFCLDSFSELYYSMSAFHAEDTCEKAANAVECMWYHTRNCTSSTDLTSVVASAKSIISMVGHKCFPMAYPELCEPLTYLSDHLMAEQSSCAFDEAMDCVNLFTAAKPALEKVPEMVCHGGRKAVMCAMVKGSACSETQKTALNNSIQAVAASVMPLCANMSMETKNPCNVTYAENQIVCNTNYAPCFAGYTEAASMCTNSAAIQACISLHLRGCDVNLVYEVQQDLMVTKKLLEDATGQSCDVVPTLPPGVVSPTYTRNATCIGGIDIMTQYLYNPNATEMQLCKAWYDVHACVLESVDQMPVMLKSYMTEIARSISEQMRLRCYVGENFELIYGKEEKVDNWDTILNVSGCNIAEAAVCLGSYFETAVYTGVTALQDKGFFCGSFLTDQLKCIHNHTDSCPAVAKARFMRVIDWSSSISTNLGICSVEPPRQCRPRKAVKCIVDLSTALLAYGEGDETNALCAALIPTEMCVTYETSGCFDDVRLNIEYTYASIAALVMSKCEEPKLYMERKSCDVEEECNFEKSKHCLMEVAEKAWSVVEGNGDRMSVCREVGELGQCAMKNTMGCKGKQKETLDSIGEMMKLLVSNVCEAGGEDMVPERTDSPKMCATIAGHCMKDFMTVRLGGTLTGSCGQAPSTIKCLMAAAKGDCHPLQRKMIKMAIEQISMVFDRVCSYDSCNVDLAKMCMKEADDLIKLAADRFMESPMMCSALEMTMSCANKHFMRCERAEIPFVTVHLMELNGISRKLCEHKKYYDIMALRTPDTAELMALAAIITNPLATKEQICPQAIAIEKGIAELAFELSSSEYDAVVKAFYLPRKIIGDMCHSEEEKKDTGVASQCDQQAAVECLKEADLVNRINEAAFYGWQGACMAVQRLMCCVTQKHSNCGSLKLAHQIISDGISLVSDHCPVEEMFQHYLAECKMPVVQPCKAADAFMCFPPMEDANRANVCSNLSMIAACVHKHAVGCSSIQTSALQFFVEQFSSWVQPCNFLVGLDFGIYSKGDDYGLLASCNSIYMTDLQQTLNSTLDLKESFCRISHKAARCYELNHDKIPPYLAYVLASNQRSYEKFEEYCDMGSKGKDGECPKGDDAGICVMGCSSDYDCEGQKKCCSNNCGYTCVMPAGVTTTAVTPVTEPAGCQVKKAATCLTAYMVGLDSLNLLPLDQRGSVCRQYWNMKHCVMTYLENCSDKRKAIFMEVDELVKYMYEVSCEESMTTTLLQIDGLCVPEVAEYCINALGEMIYYASPDSEKRVCKTSYHIMQCVQRSLESCSENVTMGVINSMEPVITMLGNSCPLASAIKCNTSAWHYIVTHAACDENAVWGAFLHFKEIADNYAKNTTAVCKAFEDISMYASMQTMLCDQDSLTMINQTWWLMMGTYGKYCQASGEMSTEFMGALEMERKCMHQPTCRSDYSECFPDDMMEASSDDICMNKEKILMCMDRVLAGCDQSYRENSFQGLMIVIGNMNLSCNFLDGINSNMTSLAGLRDTQVDPCLMNLMMGGGKWLHSHLNFDSRGICELFMNFTECSSNYLQYPMPPVYKGMFKQFVDHIKTYTKIRCEINEANREVWWDQVKDMPGMDYLIDQIEQEMKNRNTSVHDSMVVMERLFEMFMTIFKDMPHNAEEPESCERNMADSCMADTVLGAVYMGYNPLGSREAACKSTHKSYECVLHATKGCNSMTRVRYFRMLEWIARLGLSSGVCSMDEEEKSMVHECDYNGAMDCLGELSKAIVYLSSGDSRAALLSPLGPTEMCIAEKTWMCEPRYRKMVESTYHDLKAIAVMSSMSHSSDDSMKDDRMRALDMATDMCQDDDDDDEDRKSRPCDVSAAMLCVSYLQNKLPEMESNNDEACQAMFTMKLCVKRNMMGCMSGENAGVQAMMKEISEKVHCPVLECDLCSAKTCVRQLYRAVMYGKASCVDVWKTKACVRKHMSYCSGEMSYNVSMELERIMKNVSSSVCEHPSVSLNDCTMGLAKVAHKILGLGVDLEDLMMMDMNDDKMDDKDYDNMDDKDVKDDDKATTDKPTDAKPTEVTKDDSYQPEMTDKPSMLNAKQIMFLERLFSLVASNKSKPREDCQKDDMSDDESMESMCHSAYMAWHCVESQLDMVPEGMRSIASASLHLIGEAITAKCIEETQKEPLMCFSCKNAHSNEECNAQQPVTCHGDRQSCYTVVDNGRISKGCAYRVPLQKTSECVNYGKKCSYMCDKSQCNWQKHKGVIDPPTCDRRAATLCGMTLVSNMLRSDDLNCGVAMKALGCVQHFTKDCMSHKEAMMYKQAEAALHSPAMMRCYAKDIPCSCGYCSVISLARVQHNTYLTRVEKCMWAKSTQSDIMTSLLTEDCQFDDVYQLTADVKLVKSVMSDSCMEGPRAMCNLEGAEQCVHLSMLEKMEEGKLQYTDKKHFCGTAYKMLLCIRWNTEHCDASLFNLAMASSQDLLMKLKAYCDIGNLGNSSDYYKDLADLTTKIQEKMTDRVGLLQYGFGDTVYMMGEVLREMSTPVVECKPAIALRHCFQGLASIDPDNKDYCTVLSMSADCVDSMTSQCLMVQKAPVLYTLHKFASYAPSCSVNQDLRNQMEMYQMDPYAHLAMCLANFTGYMYDNYVNMTQDSFNNLCKAAVKMDTCIYNVHLPRAGKVYLASLASLSQHIMDQACSAVDRRPIQCDSDDFLCNIAAYTPPPPMDLSWLSVAEPASCDLAGASFCITSYLLRLMSSSFLNTDEFTSICWEQLTLASCVATKTQTCSPARREFFASTVEWFHNTTSVGCDMVADMRLPNCSIAKECLTDMVRSSVSREGYTNWNHVCWMLEKTEECVFQHAPACPASEMEFVHEGIQFVGNLTKKRCPHSSETLCKLSMMPAINPTATCAENNLRQCVFTYYYATRGKQLQESEYCMYEQAAENCIKSNSSNCAPYTLIDIEQAMRPGVVGSGFTCPKNRMDYDAICPVYGNCSVSRSALKINSIYERTVKDKTAGKSNAEICGSISMDMAALTADVARCSPLEITMINKVLTNIDLALTFVLGVDCSSVAPFTSSMQPVDPLYAELQTCFNTLYDSLHQSSLNATYGFNDICETSMAFNNCMATVGMPPDRPSEMIVHHLMNTNMMHIQNFITKSCLPIKITDQTVKLVKTPVATTCQQDTVFHCMAYFATKAVFMPILGEEDQLSLCGEPAHIRDMCILNKNLTEGCSDVTMMQIRTFQYMFEQLVMSSPTCSWMVTEDVRRGSARLLAGGDMMNNDGVIEVLQDQMRSWQEAVLETAKAMQEAHGIGEMRNDKDKGDDKKDDMDEEDDMDKHCNPRGATECYLYEMYTLTAEDWMGPSYDKFCRTVETMNKCMRKEMAGCMGWQQVMVKKFYSETQQYYHDKCTGKMAYMTDDGMDSRAETMLKWLDTTSYMAMQGSQSMRSKLVEQLMEMSKGKEMEWDEEELNKMAGMEIGEGVDINCVDMSMYREHARCDPAKAISFLAGMDEALLSTQVSYAGLCLKYAFSVRGYLLSTEGCDWATTMVFKMIANQTMMRMGNKCEVHIEEHCRDKRSCDPMDITKCYRPIQLHVAAIIEDKLPVNTQVCEQLAVAAKCVERLHCDDRTIYRTHETMEPALSTLTKLCYRLPVQTCTTSSMWKMAAIVLLNKRTYETSYALDYMKMHMDDDKMNMSINSTTYPNTTRPDDGMTDGRWSEEGMAKALMTLEHILSRDSGCSKDMEVDGDLATGLKYLVRYAFMYEKMVETDERFMNMMTLAMAGELRNAVGDSVGGDFGSNRQELGDLIKMVKDRFDDRGNMTRNNMTMPGNTTRGNNTTVPRNNTMEPRGNMSMEMNWKLRDVIGRIISHLIVYGNSDTFMQVETHKVFKAKMMKAIEMAEVRGNNLELEKGDEDAFERLDLNLGKDLQNAVDWEMMNILKTVYDIATLESSNLSMKHTMELLEMAQHIHTYRKQELCMSMVGAWQCTSSTLMLLPESVRGMVNQTLNSLYSITGYFCAELKCYSCDDFRDNEACNEQGMMTCKPGQVCFTYVNNGEIKKGCAAPSMGDWHKDKEMYSTCVGHGCNHPKFGARKEAEDEMCQPFKAIGCMYELLPTMLQGQEVNYREVYKAFYCMEYYTSTCILDEHREISRMAQRVKVAMIDGQCSQPDIVYTCGLSAILELADLIKTPSASRKTICNTLNQTMSNVMLADHWNQCTEYEMVQAYSELDMISSVIGADFCPGIDPRDPKQCAAERAKLPPMCNLEQVGICLYEAEVLHKIVDMIGDIEEWKDMDFMCSRLQHMLKCVSNHSSSCDDAQMKYVYQMVNERVGDAIPLCPSIHMEFAFCDATPLSEYNCMLYEGIDTCLQPTEVYKNPYILCSMNETMLNDVMTCLQGYTQHCMAVQGLPIAYIVQNYMAQSMILCGNHSMAKQIAQGIVNGEQGIAMETMMKMMMGKATGMNQDDEEAPITNLVNVILSLKTKITMTGNVTDMLMGLMAQMGEDKDEDMKAPSDNLMSMMKTSMGLAKHVSGLDKKRMYQTDVTHDMARCVYQYSMTIQRLLLYPEVSHEMACEGKAVFRKCLKKLDLPPVAKMFVMALESRIALESDRDCYYYLDDVMLLGRDIADVTGNMRMIINATGAFKNATAAAIALMRNTTIFQQANLTKTQQDLITAIIGMMSNMSRNRSIDGLEGAPKEVMMTFIKGVVTQFKDIVTVTSDCNVWMISQHITFAYMQVLSGGFFPYSQYPAMCGNLKSMYETLKPEVEKCPVDYQDMYYRALTFLHSETKEVCEQPYIDHTPPTTCHADLASQCMVDVMPLLSSAGTERSKLCAAVEQASLCLSYGLRNCNQTQALAPFLQFEHIKSIVADGCPYLTASMQCFDNNDIETGSVQICNVTTATEYCASLVTGSTDLDKCMKLPEMMNCMYRYTSSCSALEMHWAYSHLHIVLEDIVNVCNSDMMVQAYRQASASKPCSQAEQCTIMHVSAQCGNFIPETFSDCSAFAPLHSCMTGQIKGCNTIQVAMIHVGFGSVLSGAQMACLDVVSQTTMIQYEKDAARSVIACVSNYTQEMTAALMSTDAHLAICNAYGNLGQCFMGDMTEEQMAGVFPFYGTSSNVTWTLVREFCWSDEQAANMATSMMGAMYNYKPERKMDDMQKDGPTCDIQSAAKIISSFSVTSMFSSLLSPTDKMDLCGWYRNSQTSLWTSLIHTYTDNCSESTQEPLLGLAAALDANIVFSGVCAEELMICDPTSALDCGIEASREIMANSSLDNLQESICRVYDQSMECAERYTYACPQEVNWKIQEKMETSLCLSYSMIKHCPSVRKEMARDDTKIPSCDAESWIEDMREDMDDKNRTTVVNRNTTRANDTAGMMDDYKVCNLTAAYGCLSHLGMKLMSPMMQCKSMHGQYTRAMQCVDKMTSSCDDSTMSVVEVVVRMAVKTMYKMCPQVVMKPCHEPKQCRLDEAQHCVDVLAYMSSMKEMQDQHICLAREMTEICLKEKLQHCSVFGKTAMMEALKHATPQRHLVCGGDLGVCIQKFFFNTIGVIMGDVMMAQGTRIRNKIASEVTSHFMENPYMVGVSEINKRIEMNLANMSRGMREMLSGGANMSMMPSDMQMVNVGDAYLMDGVTYMWEMISGGMEEDYQTNHAKAKVIQCAAIREAFDCMDSEMHMASWSYLSSAQGTFVRQNLMQLNYIARSMCHDDMTCTFLKEPVTCQVLPAMWMTMAGLGQVLQTDNAAFCSHLPNMMANITALTSSCSDDVGQHFKAMLGFQEEAKEAICNLPSNCNVDGAVVCLRSLNKDNFCSEYDNVKNCMTGALKSCAVMTQANLTAELQEMENAYGQSCIKMPLINITDPSRLIRLEEGTLNTANILVTMSEPPSCGNNCYVKVSLTLSEDANSVSKCADGVIDIPQVLVVMDGDTSGVCNMVFTDANYSSPRVVPLIPMNDLIQDGTHYITAKLTATKIDNGVVMKETQLAEYQIVVANKDQYSVCLAFGDSVRSFDGLSHNNYFQGLFLVYKHSTLPQEVFVLKQRSLNGFGTETCAVAVKSEDDVFIIDRCRESDGTIRSTQQLYVTGTLHPFTEMYSQGGNYMVRFPSGTVVTIEDMTTSLQIMVHASTFDIGHSTGLCGVYDDMTENDLTLPNGQAITIAAAATSVNFATSRAFDRQWSVPASDLFAKSSNFPMNTLCSCGSVAGSSSPAPCVYRNSIVDTCASPLPGTDITPALKAGAAVIVTGCDRKRRQAGTGLFDGVEIDPNYDNSVTDPTWDPPRTYYLDTATTYCQQEVNNKQIISLCQQVPGISIPTDAVIQECIDKIQMTDSITDATYSLAVHIGACETEARLLISSTDATLVQLATSILNMVCPNDCSGHGSCSVGNCQCFQNWLGVDCSIEENQPPTVSSVENNGLCPLGSTDCSVITVLGNNFSDQKTPSCHFQALTIDENGATPTGSVQVVAAEYVTLTQINCPVPAGMMTSSLKSAVQVAVSNDAARLSPYYTVVTFDSACYSCSTTLCTTTTTGCVIDNVCYEAFSNKPGDVCHYCDPSLSNTGWTMKIAPPVCDLPTTQAPAVTTTKPLVTQTTTTSTTTTPPTTTPPTTTPRPTTAAPVMKTTTEGPLLSQDAQLIVVVLGVVAGLFAVLSCILAVKYCQRQPETIKDGSRIDSSSGRGSIEDRAREFDNLAYDNFSKKGAVGGVSSFQPPPHEAAQPYPSQNIVDMSAMEHDPHTKL